MYEGSHFFTSSPTYMICRLFYDSHIERCEVVSLWFGYAFLWWLAMLSIFSCACWPPVGLLWRNVCLCLLPMIFNQWYFQGSCVEWLTLCAFSALPDNGLLWPESSSESSSGQVTSVPAQPWTGGTWAHWCQHRFEKSSWICSSWRKISQKEPG